MDGLIDKQYLELLFSTLREELRSVSMQIAGQQSALHKIELQITQKDTQLEADIHTAFTKIRELEKEIETQESRRQESDISLGRRIANFQNEQVVEWEAQHEKWNIQATENEKNKNLRTVIYWLAGIVGVQIIILLWSMLINGGIANITP